MLFPCCSRAGITGVDYLNYNLDLRSPEYKSKLNKHKIKPFKFMGIVLLLLLPMIIFQGLVLYQNYLVQQASELDKNLTILRRDAEPLINMSRELEDLEARALVEQELIPVKENWSAGLKLISNIAPQGITISSIEIRSGGSVQIYGTSENMQAPAQYTSSLARHSAFKSAELKMIAMNPDQRYNFQVDARLQQGDDPAGDDPENVSDY